MQIVVIHQFFSHELPDFVRKIKQTNTRYYVITYVISFNLEQNIIMIIRIEQGEFSTPTRSHFLLIFLKVLRSTQIRSDFPFKLGL